MYNNTAACFLQKSFWARRFFTEDGYFLNHYQIGLNEVNSLENQNERWNSIITSNYVITTQLIWQIHILFHRSFGRVIQSIFELSDEKIKFKYYNKWITTRDNGNVQSQDQEENKLNSTIIANSGTHTLHTLTDEKIIKNPFNKDNVATIKGK